LYFSSQERGILEISKIYAPVQEDLLKVRDRLKAVSKVDFDHLSELLDYSLQNNGKMIRPALTLLSGKLYNHNLDRLLAMATAVELMHTATLIHDDAIDNSMVRRGKATVNTLWGEDEAVLLGDYLFAQAGAVTATTENLRVIRNFAETLKTISSGEINQAYNSFNLEQSRDQYFKRIAQKTAALFSLSTESGAVLSEAPEESIQIIAAYGYNLGIAFQIVDDILDYIGTEEELGKPTGSDLTQGTLTLPAMLILEYYPKDNPVKKLFSKKGGIDEIKLVIEMVRNSPAVQECYQIALNYCVKASRNLKQLPDNANRQSLIELVDFITYRKK
jgi:geranylgeranyl pyrophosphate synthase